jgi:hypothetical protein
MTRWSAITRGRRSALAYGSRSATAAEETTSTDSYTTSGDATGASWSSPHMPRQDNGASKEERMRKAFLLMEHHEGRDPG